MRILLILVIICISAGCAEKQKSWKSISGVYPHLAMYNNEGECGTGAVVPWSGRLWIVTYGPHLPFGSSDKLYEVTSGLNRTVRPESIGGTPAARMIHNESRQLFIGPYVIDSTGRVRVIGYDKAPGRYTGYARHLTDPGNKIFLATMEEGFYEVDVRTLEVETVFPDGNLRSGKGNDTAPNQPGSLLPGAHGKGLYSGKGVLVYSNNGESSKEALERFDIESGVLAEWNGKEWRNIRRSQFTEVTGPGGITGNLDPVNDPLWATGWDHKSVIIAVKKNGSWGFFRLPRASRSYDGAHGWNTEWPRIRDIGEEGRADYLMTMHGMFWHFPGSFSPVNSSGIRPGSAYLKVIGDFTRWNGSIVLGCDDSAQREFLNKRSAKGEIEGPGQSNSNLWFISPGLIDSLGPVTSEGALWLNDQVLRGIPSEPFLFAGWPERCAWILNSGTNECTLTFETDLQGNGIWKPFRTISLMPGQSEFIRFNADERGEWIRIIPGSGSKLTALFCYTGTERRKAAPDPIFRGLASVSGENSTGGLLYGLGNNRRALGISSLRFTSSGVAENGYYELDSALNLVKKDDPGMLEFINTRFAVPADAVRYEESSVLIVDDKGRRWRLPNGDEEYGSLSATGALRICREVATERDLFSCSGTFYELPAENADGFAKIRPVASHKFRIHDYASYRGLLVLTGIDTEEAEGNPHVIISSDRKAAVWTGVIDDLWKLGKPVGTGGPWKESEVKSGEPSDPYLIGFYDKKSLRLSHDQKGDVTFTLEVNPSGDAPWMRYLTVTVPGGEVYTHTFPAGFQARWIRFISDRGCRATAWLVYE